MREARNEMLKEGQDFYTALGDKHWWLTSRYEILERSLTRYAPKRRIRFLDAGCGPGMLLGRVDRCLDIDYIGLDNSIYGVEIAKNKNKTARFMVGDVVELPAKPDSFDVVVAHDLVEHIKDDSRALTELYRVLAPGGLAFFAIPAFQCLWGYHDERYGHHRRYQLNDFRKLVLDAGYEIKELTYGQAMFFIPMYLFRLFKRITKNKSDDFTLPATRLSRFIHKLIILDFKMCRKLNLPWGCNIFCVAAKPLRKRADAL